MDIKEKYKLGTKVKLIKMDGEPQMPSGMTGMVRYVDDANQIHVCWDNGSTLALVPEVDEFEIIH